MSTVSNSYGETGNGALIDALDEYLTFADSGGTIIDHDGLRTVFLRAKMVAQCTTNSTMFEAWYDATNYKVDLYAKVAFPFVCIIMCIVGTGIALKEKKREGLALNIAYGIGIVFLYWIFYSFCVSLGYGEMLPPFIAAWTANLVFLSFGVITLLNAE